MSNFIYPKFSDEKEFELFVNDIFKRRTQNINFQIYGRKGQKQFGIDGYGFDYIQNQFIVTQCKNYNSGKEGKSKFKNDLEKALKVFDENQLPFKEKVITFYYVTSIIRDSAISNEEEGIINQERTLNGLIPFKVFTWDDLCDEMEKYEEILYRFYLKNLPSGKAENIEYKLQNIDKTTMFKFSENISDEKMVIFQNSFIEKINLKKDFNNEVDNESILILGLHGFGKKGGFNGKTDLDLDFSVLYEGNKDGLDDFLDSITKIIKYLSENIGLKKIIIKSHIQPSLSIYIGKFFKDSTSGIEFISLINNKGIFISSKSEGLLYSEPGISEKKIYIKDDGEKNNIVLFYNISQDNLGFENELLKNTFKEINPKYGFCLKGNRIENSSHGFSQTKYIANKIKTIANEYKQGGEKLNIYLILICPEQIAFIIGTLIERINADIYLYYQNPACTDYTLFDKLRK